MTNAKVGVNAVIIATLDTTLANSATNYSVSASAGSGSAVFVIKNISGTSLSEAVLINFVVLKGSIS